MRTIWQRFLSLFRRGRLDRELSEEIGAHLAMQEEEFRQQGMDPAAARAAARRTFGGVAQTQEAYRDRRGIPWLEIAAKDIRYALRGLRRNPGFTAAAIISLALGIGANTAIFSLFHALMLRMLPVARPGELVSLYRTGGWGKGYSSYPLYLELAKRSDLFTGVLARTGVEKVRFTPPGGRPQFTQREFVSGNYFSVLGVAPALGRLFTDADNRVPQGHPLAVLSYDFWQNRFGADPQRAGPQAPGGRTAADRNRRGRARFPRRGGREPSRGLGARHDESGQDHGSPQVVALDRGAPPAGCIAQAGASGGGRPHAAAPRRHIPDQL